MYCIMVNTMLRPTAINVKLDKNFFLIVEFDSGEIKSFDV